MQGNKLGDSYGLLLDLYGGMDKIVAVDVGGDNMDMYFGDKSPPDWILSQK